MKLSLLLSFLIFFFFAEAQLPSKTQNIFIVTLDGIRWQEIFKGADPEIINNARYTTNVDLAKMMFLDSSIARSRKKLLPFFWNVIQQKGQLYGNRLYKNKFNVTNGYRFSYPGYNEIFTGYADIHISSNENR